MLSYDITIRPVLLEYQMKSLHEALNSEVCDMVAIVTNEIQYLCARGQSFPFHSIPFHKQYNY